MCHTIHGNSHIITKKNKSVKMRTKIFMDIGSPTIFYARHFLIYTLCTLATKASIHIQQIVILKFFLCYVHFTPNMEKVVLSNNDCLFVTGFGKPTTYTQR